MGEKSAEARHLEHENFGKKLDGLQQQISKVEDDFENYIFRRLDDENNFRLGLLKEVHSIDRAISVKCEQDSTIIGNVNRHEAALVQVQGQGSETAKALAVVTENMKALKTATDRDLKAAHDAIRETDGKIEKVGKRVEKLEHKGGKLALKILYGIAGAGGTVAITLWVQRLLGG